MSRTWTEPRDAPLAFTDQMVRAERRGEKTETRRTIRWPFDGQPNADELDNLGDMESLWVRGKPVKCPYGLPGDTLWVREWFRLPGYMNPDPASALAEKHGVIAILGVLEYLADQQNINRAGRKRAGRFMPRWASRTTLEVVDLNVERVGAITDQGALAEGIGMIRGAGYGLPEWDDADLRDTPRDAYLDLFYGINRTTPPRENPWVWVVKFKRSTT